MKNEKDILVIAVAITVSEQRIQKLITFIGERYLEYQEAIRSDRGGFATPEGAFFDGLLRSAVSPDSNERAARSFRATASKIAIFDEFAHLLAGSLDIPAQNLVWSAVEEAAIAAVRRRGTPYLAAVPDDLWNQLDDPALCALIAEQMEAVGRPTVDLAEMARDLEHMKSAKTSSEIKRAGRKRHEHHASFKDTMIAQQVRLRKLLGVGLASLAENPFDRAMFPPAVRVGLSPKRVFDAYSFDGLRYSPNTLSVGFMLKAMTWVGHDPTNLTDVCHHTPGWQYRHRQGDHTFVLPAEHPESAVRCFVETSRVKFIP